MNRVRHATLEIAIAASVLVHGAVALVLSDAPLALIRNGPEESSRIAISLVASPPVAAAPPIAEPAKTPPPAMPAAASAPPPPELQPAPVEPLPVLTARAPRAAAPRFVPEPVPLPIPASPPSPEATSTPVETETMAAVEAPSAVASSATSPPSSASANAPMSPEARVDAMPSYVAEVRRRIEAKKRYPSLARRKREEGRVVARVSIDSGGELRGVELDGNAPLSLRRATRSAIHGASPFPVPPRGELLVEISVLWKVRR